MEEPCWNIEAEVYKMLRPYPAVHIFEREQFVTFPQIKFLISALVFTLDLFCLDRGMLHCKSRAVIVSLSEWFLKEDSNHLTLFRPQPVALFFQFSSHRDNWIIAFSFYLHNNVLSTSRGKTTKEVSSSLLLHCSSGVTENIKWHRESSGCCHFYLMLMAVARGWILGLDAPD